MRVVAGASVRPMRAWLKLSTIAQSSAKALGILIDEEDTPTGIVDITEGKRPQANELVNVYTLDGKLVRAGVRMQDSLRNLSKGTYVVNGKVIIIGKE